MHSLYRCLFWVAGLNGLTLKSLIITGGDQSLKHFLFTEFENIRLDISYELSAMRKIHIMKCQAKGGGGGASIYSKNTVLVLNNVGN